MRRGRGSGRGLRCRTRLLSLLCHRSPQSGPAEVEFDPLHVVGVWSAADGLAQGHGSPIGLSRRAGAVACFLAHSRGGQLSRGEPGLDVGVLHGAMIAASSGGRVDSGLALTRSPGRRRIWRSCGPWDVARPGETSRLAVLWAMGRRTTRGDVASGVATGRGASRNPGRRRIWRGCGPWGVA